MMPIAYKFRKGYKIQVRICGKDEKHFLSQIPANGRTITVSSGAGRVSSISLPIVEDIEQHIDIYSIDAVDP